MKGSWQVLGWIALGSTLAVAKDEAPGAAVEDGAYRVSVDGAEGTFAIQALPSGRGVVTSGKLGGRGGSARTVEEEDKIFGRGRGVEVAYPDGNRDRFLLFPGLPFVAFRETLHNGGAEEKRVRQVRPLSAAVDVGVPAAAVRVLGTGGLGAPDRNPGSYAWLAAADPATRRGVVAGWLTSDRGSGVVFSRVADGRVVLEAEVQYGRLTVPAGGDEPTETFLLGAFDDARLGLEAWASAVARNYGVKLPPQPAGYCTWYSRPHGGASDERHVAEQAAFAAEKLAPFGFSVVQIDDGWQRGIGGNGPKKVFLDHDPKGPYPHGMKAIADEITRLGLTPGIWFMPFAGTHSDPFFKDHPGWFARHEDGKPFETSWGGTCLDTTNPEARDYLRAVVRRITSEWGYRYLKMDGLWTGTATRQMYVNSGYKDDGMGEAVLHDPRKTNIEAYRDGLRLIRETAGREVFLLGCCAPQNMRSYGGAFGLLDAMRIGPDNNDSWGGLVTGPVYASRNYHLHGRVWYNDPDPLYVRASVPIESARLICSWVAISGALNLCSEWLPSLPPDRLDLLRRTMPAHGLLPRPVDLFEAEPAKLWLLTDDRHGPRRDVLAISNWESRPIDVDLALERAGLPAGAYAAFDFWADAPLPTVEGRLRTTVPPRSCRVLALRPLGDHPVLLSTSRHITQGIVDVAEESWDAPSRTLAGQSRVVGGDPYELRVASPAAPRGWKAVGAELSADDRAADARIQLGAAGPLARATITSPASRTVSWRLTFEPAPAD